MCAGFPATDADSRVTMLEWGGPIILGENNNPALSIGESVLFIDDGPNESIRELIRPIVGNRNALDEDAASLIDVCPPMVGVIVIEYHSQAMRIEFKFLDIVRCDEALPSAVSQNAVWIRFHVIVTSEGATITDLCRLDFRTLGIGRV